MQEFSPDGNASVSLIAAAMDMLPIDVIKAAGSHLIIGTPYSRLLPDWQLPFFG